MDTALVTGASRGVGKGVAVALAATGFKVFATGRSVGSADLPAPIERIHCDHTSDTDTEAAFRQIEDAGGLAVLVNSAWGGYERMMENGEFTWPAPFWQQPPHRWSSMIDAGVRAAFFASAYAARIMIRQRRGLIVNISYWAAQRHLGNTVYGIAKAATDKMYYRYRRDRIWPAKSPRRQPWHCGRLDSSTEGRFTGTISHRWSEELFSLVVVDASRFRNRADFLSSKAKTSTRSTSTTRWSWKARKPKGPFSLRSPRLRAVPAGLDRNSVRSSPRALKSCSGMRRSTPTRPRHCTTKRLFVLVLCFHRHSGFVPSNSSREVES